MKLNYLSDRSYENKTNVRKVEKALKYELRRCEVEAMDKISEDLEDAARRHNSKMLYWHVNKLRRSSHPGLVRVNDKNGATISDKERVKKRLAEYFENVPCQTKYSKENFPGYESSARHFAEGAAGRHNSKILYWHVNKVKGTSPS